MKSCSLCSTEMKFSNTALFGGGKLNDGGEICSKCIGKVGYSVSLKKHSLSDIQALLAKKVTDKEEKKIQEEEDKKLKEERKAVAEAEKKIQQEEKKEQKKAEMDTRMQEMKAESDEKKQRLEALKLHIKNLPIDNISTFLGRKEINELPNILSPEEAIDNIIQGTYNKGLGILVSTNRRLVFVDKGLLFGIKVEDFPLDKITTIQYETGLIFGKVKIHTSGNVATIEDVDKSAARKFSEFVREKLSRPKEQPQPVLIAAAPAAPDVLEQLEKLGKLKASGILSDEEFAEQKAKLLAKL